jgi:U32 family peptidase
MMSSESIVENNQKTAASAAVKPRPLLELLSPAGNWECARAAVANGADAIFFGLPRFNARMRADNFTEEELPELMAFLHQHGVRGFVAMNTLIFTGELEAAAAQLQQLERAGVDAIIVQDLGLAQLCAQITPRIEIHASTQMTITSPEGLRFVHERLGLDRAVLARELSLREIEKFRATQSGAVPLEVFVHGALCVAYSGQCLTSESLGQRSANRGECAQACRMPYELIVDGQKRELGDLRYLLSPQDLAAYEEIPRLVELGVTSFKIEGRLKTPEYVAAVTRVYRQAIDAAEGRSQPLTAQEKKKHRYELEMAFSRGLYTGWMHGVQHQELVHARYGKKRGAYLGTVSRVGDGSVELMLAADVHAGDGVVFENPANTDHEMGGRVERVDRNRIYFDWRARIDFDRIENGTRVYKTDDPQLNSALRHTWSQVGNDPGRHAVHLTAVGAAEAPLRLTARMEAPSGGEIIVEVLSSQPMQVAKNKPLTPEVAQQQWSRLGGTAYHVADLQLQLSGAVMLPLSELNQMRRQLVEALDEAVTAQVAQRERPRGSLAAALRPIHEQRVASRKNETAAPQLSVLVRSFAQLTVALEKKVGVIYADFEDIRRASEIVQQVRAAGAPSRIFLATPRIQKAGEEGFFKLIERAQPDGVLIRNLGAIEYFRACPQMERRGDFSLNVANPLTAAFLREHGLPQLTISYDLTIQQVLDLLAEAPPAWFEITLHQHMPMFHMEHCVFSAFMSNGKDYTDCGRPCEKHQVQLRDRVGQLHPLTADVGCRNTLFNGRAQTGARFYHELRQAGLAHFRVELLREDAAESAQIITAYQSLLAENEANAGAGADLWLTLQATSQLGVTEGTLEEKVF